MKLNALRAGMSRLAPLAAGFCLAASVLAVGAPPAQARGRHYWRAARAPETAQAPAEVDASKYASVVVDANTGRELYGINENALRHPASITKVMTLYLLFEQLEKGELSLSSQIPVSEHAAGQEPSKLGLAPGDTISVEDAIKAVVTRSANDIAVAIAEAVGHDEDHFAALMTRKAHQLGMSRTLYRNASGLPNDEQWTTAHDLARLGRAIQERYPKYFRYFSLHEFVYDGETIGNHDHLLGRIEGVDGIKTGYTRASGFNLLTSMHRDGRALVAVVMGGRSAPARDRLMERLIETHIADASPVRTATRLAESSADAYEAPLGRDAARGEPERVADADEKSAQGDSDDVAEEAAPSQAALRHASPPPRRVSEALAKAAKLDTAKLGWKVGSQSAPVPLRRSDAETLVARNEQQPARKHGGWAVQFGMTDDRNRARILLRQAKLHDRALANADGVAEKVRRDGDTLYRVRFAGLDVDSARSACQAAKRHGLRCEATRD